MLRSDLASGHLQAVAAIDPQVRLKLQEKSNARGLLQLAGHWALIAGLATAIGAGVPVWPVLMLPLGILIMFQFTALHEAAHHTAFHSAWLNRLVASVSGMLVLVAPEWFRYFHLAHHRHTQDPDHDPELEGGKPETMAEYLLYLTGISVWKANILTLLRNAFGQASYSYVPARRQANLVWEARLMLAAYAMLAAVSIWYRSTFLVWLWLAPVVIGQPFLRAYLLAEHTRCPLVANMLENSRTTFTTALVRFIAWNMPYHAEHHSWPQVPFWQLPAFHALLRGELLTTERGYVRFHRKLSGELVDRGT